MAHGDAKFHLTWASLHLYAAALAVIAVIMHIGSYGYHLRRYQKHDHY